MLKNGIFFNSVGSDVHKSGLDENIRRVTGRDPV